MIVVRFEILCHSGVLTEAGNQSNFLKARGTKIVLCQSLPSPRYSVLFDQLLFDVSEAEFSSL